jgi:hypothetical protein
VGYVHETVDRVHVDRLTGLDPSLNVGRSTLDGHTRLEREGICFPDHRK